MRIFYINARFLTHKITGVQRYAVEISRQLKKLCPEVEFAAPKNIIHKGLAKDLDVKIIGKHTGHVWEQHDLPGFLKKRGTPLLLNLSNTAPLFYKNSLVTIHDIAFFRNPLWFSKKFFYFYRFLIPRIAKKSLKVVTVSDFSKKEIMDILSVDEGRIEVIYNAVSSKFMDRAKSGFFNEYDKYILAVSSLDPRKNFVNLLLAFKGLKLQDTKLIVVGSRHRVFADVGLKEVASSCENIVFVDNSVDDDLLAGLYKNAILFVYPSLYEGFGLPPLESMACGCPVVVSNAASLPEVCGDAAYYVNPHDVDSIADGMRKVLTDDDLRRSLVKKGLERVNFFSWERSAREFLRVFEEVSVS